jgi:hypothetical protein
MAGLTVDQWKANRRKSERNIANSFFSEVSQMNGINELMKQQDSVEKIRNMQQVKTRVNSLLQQADGVRQYYANAGNKKMMKSVEDASTYLKNINSGIDKYMPSEEKVKQITTNQSIYDNNRNSTFQQLTDKQVQNKVNATDKNRAELENENNILEQIKNEKGTDNDYKSIVAYAKNKVKELESGKTDSNIDKKTTDKEFNSYKQLSRDNDKFTTNKNNDAIQRQIDSYKQIIDEYSDYDKYGKSNMAKWSAETKDMDYAQRQDYIKKLNTNNSQNKLEEKISGYESGKEYLNSLADGEKATAQGFFDYLDNNNRNFISEARRNGKNAQKEEQRLYNLEEKSKKWEEGSNDRAIKTEYLDKMAKSNLNSYEDYETLYNEYDEKRKNAKSLQEENDIKLDWNNNYGDEYLRKKQEHNFNNLADEDKTKVVQTVENGSNLDELKAQLMDKYRYDDNEANAVINYAQAQKNEATAEQEQKDYAKYGKEHPYVGTAASVPLSLASGAGYVGSMWEKLKRATGTSENPIDYNSDANRIGQNAQSLREGVKENMKTDVGKFVYDAFASTLDSVATIPLNLVVPGATTLILGSSAATSSMLDVHNKGASDSQALMTGLGAGVFEGLFEKVSLDKVVSMSNGVNSIKNFLKNTVKSMGIEGSEEGFTEIANIVYDNLVNGELSDYQQSIQSYMQQGYTKTDAEQEARKDMAVRIAENVGGGAIGGAFFSIPLGGYNYAKGKAYRQMSEKGQNIINNGTYSEIENHIRENYGEDSEVYSQFKNAETNDPAMVGYIANTVAADEYNKATQSYVDAVAPAISERLQELDVPKNEADNIAMQSMERMMNGNGRKNVDAGQYQEAYDTVEKELINHMQGNETDWTSRMNLSEYRTHQENTQDMVKLANGESLKPTLDENTQSKLNAEMDEKQSNGAITEGGAHLIDNPSVNFEPAELMVNKEGKTIVISKEGQNYNMEDVAADRDTVALYELGESYEPEQRKKFFKAYAEGGTLVDPVDFAANYKVAYDYGAQNKGIASATSNRRIRTNMTLDQIALAYTAGKMEYQKNLIDRVVVTNNTRGSVSFDNVDTTKLDETQKAVVRVAQMLSEVTGAKYVFYESKQDANGKYIGENGSYNSTTNEIRIDINAGKISANQGHNIMIATLAHELTHYIQNFSTTQYAKLEEFVFDALTKSTGINIDELIADEINSLKKTLGEDITEDVARKELVARGCELMLTDANSIKELAKRDKGLFGKIKAKIDEWVKNIIKACNSIINKDGSIKSGTVSKEAMLLKDFALQMRTMWNEALKEAGESNSRIVSKNVDVLDMVRYDANNKPYVEIDEDILDGVAEEDYEQTAKNVLTELFKEGIDYKNNVFTMNKRDKNEFVRNRTMTYWLHNNKKLRMDKLRLSKNAMEIIKNADNWKNVEKKYNNTNNEKIVDFAYGYVNVSVFGNDYSAKVVTGVDKRGIIHLYDISDMMPTEIKRSANTTVHPKRGASIFNGASIDESINEDRKNVNKNILYSYAGEIEARDTSNRMNLSEKERREKIPEKGNENTVYRFFSLRQSVEETKDLIAVHNLSEKNLLENIKLGGFPMPSIAITKANNSYDNFGDISVVFKKDTINPSMEENKVYSGDAWTPMFPRTEWKLNEKAMEKMADMFNTSTNYIEQYVKDPETAVKKLKAEPKVKEAFVENEKADIEKKTKMPDYETKIFSNEASRQFIEENNITVDDIMENDEIKRELANKVYPPKEGEKNFYKRMRENLIERLNRYKLEDDYEIFKGNVEPIFDQTSYDEAVDEYVNKHSEQYTKYIEDALENVYEDKYLVKEDVEPLKANGERKSFNELHMPYEINNIVTLMKKQKKGKGGGFFGGAGNLKGAATETFTSIDEIRRNKYKIQNISEDELRKKYKSLNSKIQEIDNYILGEENDGVEARLRKTENINETMVEAFALDKFTKSNVKEKFNDSNIEITDSVYEQMKELRDELKEIPVQYFEAKPERAVSTNEIAYVVVPNSVSEKTKEALRKNGIEYKEYAAGDKEARKKAVNSDSTVLFQNRNYSYDELVKKPPMNIPVVKAKAISEINRKSIVEMAMNNIKSHKGIEFRGKNPVVTNIDTGDKIQVTTGGIRHGLAGRTNEAGIFVAMNLTEAIENGIKVNESSIGRKNADNSYILMGAMDNEAKERYYYRLVVNRYESNNMGTYYVDDLYAVRAKKEETFTAVMPTRVTANADASNISSKLNVSDFLKAVKDYYGFELSKDVNEKLGLDRGKSDIEGLMYQKRYSEPRTYEEALKQNKEYRDIINNLKSQFEITKGHKVGAKGISRLTSRLIRETNTAIERNTLSENLNEVFNTAVKEGLSADEVVRDLKSVVYTALNDRKENYKITDYSKGILDDVRTTPIRLSESQKAEIEYTTGMTYNDWRKSMFGKLRINENGTALDSIWGELSAKYPATFDSDTNWRDQPAVLMNIIEDLKTDYENEYGFDFEDAADYIAGELLEEYNTLPEVKTYADRQKEKLNGLQAEYNDKVSKLRKRYSDNYREYKKKLSQEVQKSKQEWREEQKYREENLKMKYQAMIKQRETNIRNRENSVWNTREKEKVRNTIIRNVKSISRKIVTPTNTNHIPEGFRQKTAEFCKEFLKDTSVFSYDDLDRLRVAYEALGRSTEDTYLRGSYDEDIDNMLYTLRDTIKNKRLAQLTRVELEQVKDITDHFAYIIKNENEIFTNGKKMEYTELSKKALRELSSKKEKVFKRTKSGTVNTFMDKAGNFMYDNYTPIYFFKELGPTFESLYTDVRKGQDKWGKNIAKAADYMQNAKSEYGYDKWDNKKLELTNEIKLTREQAMYLYATAKREKLNKLQNAHHLKKGGIIFEDRIVKEGKVINAEKTQKISYKVTDGDLIKIDSFLTKEQKAYADKMVKYLSNDMASLGNETSMQLYGIKKFGESYYFPYKVASSEKQTSADGKAKINSTLKSQSFTKSTVKEARNAVVIGNFTDAVAEHIDRMCTYNALAVAQDNINRVYNYRDIIWEEGQQVGSGMTIKQVLESVGGKKAGNYLDMFLLSINDGIKADPTEGLANQLIGSFKKGAVYASASVMIQQPSAICRAFALVNPKYFAETVFTKRDWEECKKYNGVAVVKELGGFDTGVGQGTIDYITDRKEESKFGRAMSKADDILGSLPGKMDELTWCHIWNAIKAETADKYNLKGEELLNKASERFDEVINLSQVYDSVLAKSVNMNSKSALMKSATAFMAEPTVTWNMFTDALRSKKKGYITKAMSAIILQTVVNAGLKALIQAARNSSDDDKDKSYVEKYVKSFSGDVFGTYGLTGDLSPLTWIPFVKDVVNIFEGYDVERADMTLISDVADAYKKVSKAYFGDGDVESKVDAGEEMAQSLAAFFGIPLKNMLRDYNATKNLFNDVINKNMTSTKQVGKAFMEGMGFEYSNKKYINEYISTGDRTTIKDIEDNKRKELKEKYPLYSDKQIEAKVNAYVKSQITSQIKSRYLDGDEKEKAEIIDFMKKSKLYLNDKKKDESRKTVREWEVSRLKDEYIQADSQKTRKEIRTKLWNTGKWKNKKLFNKTLKSWISD